MILNPSTLITINVNNIFSGVYPVYLIFNVDGLKHKNKESVLRVLTLLYGLCGVIYQQCAILSIDNYLQN